MKPSRTGEKMLESLRVSQFVLIDDVEVTFEPGLSVITGETGAGKSLLIGALKLALGERAGGDLVRPGAGQGTVEAGFRYNPRSALGRQLERLLDDAGIETDDGALILRRMISADGRNRCFVNGAATPLKTLAALGELLVDLHGQHAHQSLLRPAVYLDLLDAYGGLESEAEALAALYQRREAAREALAALTRDEESRLRELDMLRFQVGEIEAAQLDDEEEETALRAERERLRHADLLHSNAAMAGGALTGDDAICDRLAAAQSLVEAMARVDPTLSELAEQLDGARMALEEAGRALQRYDEQLEHDPARLEAVEARLHQLARLQRKYGATLADVIAFGETARARLAELDHADERRGALEAELARLDGELGAQALALHERRAVAAAKISKAIQKGLSKLALADAVCELSTRIAADEQGLALPNGARARIGARGIDQAEFWFAANPGAAPQPLRHVASGGELSRVMLAIKSALAASSRVPTLIFDEIDAGIGGRTADAVGDMLRELGGRFQLLCITHLPAIAAKAQRHYVVEKTRHGKQALTAVRALDERERVAELTRMLGGAVASPEARSHAEALLRGER